MKATDKAVFRSWEYWVSLFPHMGGLILFANSLLAIYNSECLTGRVLLTRGGLAVAGLSLTLLAIGWRNDLYERVKARLGVQQ